MLSLLIAVAVGLVVIVVAWHLLRAFAAIAIVAVLVVLAIGLFDHLHLSHGHRPAVQFAGLRHSVTHDLQRLEHRVTQH